DVHLTREFPMAMSRGFQTLFTRPVSRPIRMFARQPRSPRKTKARFRPSLEALEDRLVPANFLVTNTADDTGAGSLPRATLDANALAGPDTITFDIPGSGLQTITLGSDLPEITDAVEIDGYSQPGASPNTLAVGSDAVLLIELSG